MDKNPQTTEKVSVNINAATLAEIDMLVDEGFYSNRSDFINQAVREALKEQNQRIERFIRRETESTPTFFAGISRFTKKDFEKWAKSGNRVDLKGYGILILPDDCDDLIISCLNSISVRGKVYCSERIRKVYLPNL